MPSTAPPTPSADCCLFLDVDGTLIPFTDSPLATVADDDLKTILADVESQLGGRVAFVSGRSIGFLDALFAPLRWPTAGLHGIERRAGFGAAQPQSPVDARLDPARGVLRAFTQDHPGSSLEDKGSTLAVHYRGVPALEPLARAECAQILAQLGPEYHVQAGSMVFEIKPRRFTKATAIEAFLSEPPFAGTTPVFLGDDITDLDGFRLVESRGGMSIAVGERVAAQWHLSDPAAVRRWLRQIAPARDASA
jgi:trehalose 6-phosphate phosphatase